MQFIILWFFAVLSIISQITGFLDIAYYMVVFNLVLLRAVMNQSFNWNEFICMNLQIINRHTYASLFIPASRLTEYVSVNAKSAKCCLFKQFY